MGSIQIGATVYKEELLEDLKRRMEGTDFSWSLKNTEDLSYMEIETEGMLDSLRLKTYLTDCLTDYILGRYEERFVAGIVDKKYAHHMPSERKALIDFAMKKLSLSESKGILDRFWAMEREQMVRNRLQEYIDGSELIVVNGFALFRLKAYRKELEEIVEKAAEEYLMAKEYDEFIELLQYFVEAEEPRVKLMQVFKRHDGSYLLLDERFKEVADDGLGDFQAEAGRGELGEDDYLVSALISAAPEKIILHDAESFENKEVLNTLRRVFRERIEICNECALCRLKKEAWHLS